MSHSQNAVLAFSVKERMPVAILHFITWKWRFLNLKAHIKYAIFDCSNSLYDLA